jgi:hypothetical protein
MAFIMANLLWSMFVHGGLKYCGERSIFLVSICKIKVLDLLVAYSSNLVGFKQYGRIG